MRKICVITGTRAEYGLLSRLIREIDDDNELQLQIIATNMHLSSEYGLTYQEIEKDGFCIDKKVHMLISSDTANATVKSIGLATIGLADAYEDLKPDLIVILGDRYEMLAAASAALIYRIPVAHLYGGEITEGAYDDAIRHAITKMSHLHFTATEEYRKRVIQLGEQPSNVFCVGSIGVENTKEIPLMNKEEIEQSINFCLDKKTVLVTFHPVTLGLNDVKVEIDQLLSALRKCRGIKVLFTMPNSDTGGKIIINEINRFVEENKTRSLAFVSLGVCRYLSVMQFIGGVVGNSSSGITEAPSFGIPTLNIGDRQKGRLMSESVICCGMSEEEISTGLNRLFSEEMIGIARNQQNPYEKSNTTKAIFQILKQYPLENIAQKFFYNL